MNGGREEEIEGVPAGDPAQADGSLSQGGKHTAFALGSFAYGDVISYRLYTPQEEKRFAFAVHACRSCTSPQRILRDGDAVHAVMDGFALTFTAGESLTVRAHTGTVTGEACDTATLALTDGLTLTVSKSFFIWELKRLSDVLMRITEYDISVSPAGISRIAQTGMLQSRYVFGTGERFDRVNQKGLGTNGRVVEHFTQQGDQTYLPIPFFMTERGFGLFRHTDIPAVMRFGDTFTVEQRTQGETLFEDEILFGDIPSLLRQFIGRTGKPVLPPDWAFGVWMSANGWNCDAEVDAQLEAIRRYDYPADVMVLEAWSDEQTFYRWNDDGSWRDPADTVRRIREAGLHLVLWQIPIVKYEWDGAVNAHLARDAKEAIERGYVIKNADGTPYRITEKWFHHSLMLDFTNPQAVRWWFDKRRYLLSMGVEGFKTDGGEFLFADDARLYSGQSGLEAHNLYPAQYIGAYHGFLRENGVNGVVFSRADYTGAQTRPIHWAGDQISTWEELSAQLTAGLSAGLSGLIFWGFDIGGFAGELPGKELYLRATAMACFGPVMQWHAEPRSGQFYATHEDGFNNDRSPWNLAKVWGDESILTVASAYARMRKRMKPYLIAEAAYCAAHARPMMAHLAIDYPQDEKALACDTQYMLGRTLLVAPIVTPGAAGRAVYLPEGTWKNVFTGECFAGGQTVYVPCALEQIPVFQKLCSGKEA